jgi:hypothetical protein
VLNQHLFETAICLASPCVTINTVSLGSWPTPTAVALNRARTAEAYGPSAFLSNNVWTFLFVPRFRFRHAMATARSNTTLITTATKVIWDPFWRHYTSLTRDQHYFLCRKAQASIPFGGRHRQWGIRRRMIPVVPWRCRANRAPVSKQVKYSIHGRYLHL